MLLGLGGEFMIHGFDRRVISGVIHVIKSGGRWVDAPSVYGPRKTLYNRFQRWSAKGVWSAIFHALANAGGPPAQLLIDSSAVRAHRYAAGGKRGSEIRRSADHAADAPPRSTHWPTACADPSRSC
jgi:transposase